METSLPEVHPPGDLRPDFPGPTDSQRLCGDDVGKDKGSLGVPTLVNYHLPSHRQNGREVATHCSCGCGIPDSRLRGYQDPTTLPNGVVCDSSVQVQPIVVAREVSIDFPQQQVHKFRCEGR